MLWYDLKGLVLTNVVCKYPAHVKCIEYVLEPCEPTRGRAMSNEVPLKGVCCFMMKLNVF